jgi:lipoprotein NlpI
MRSLYPGCFLACLLAVAAADPAPKDAAGWLQRGVELAGRRKYDEAVAAFGKCLELDPKNAEALDRRGSAQFMRGKFAESVADFDRFLKLRPKQSAGHWRRGISLYYAGKYDEGRQQFEGYEKVDTNDVENAVWHFLCVARKDGVEKARAKVLKIGKDKRVPMMEVYELFRGKLKPAGVLAAAEAGDLSAEQRKPRLFYAHLYLGIYADVLGDRKKAREHLALAAGKYKVDHYMGEVARVHHELLSKDSR